MTTPDVGRPKDDPYGLLQGNWPKESEGAYRAAEVVSSDASVTAQSQAASADDAQRQTIEGMKGRTADSVFDAYAHLSRQFQQQSQTYTTIGGWMTDAAGKISGAKGHISDLVRTGTSEIKDALDSELSGSSVTPSSTELTTKFRGDISAAASKLTTDLDGIGHSLHGDPGSSRAPSYTSVPVSSTPEHADPRATVAAYNHGQSPEVTPHQLPPMPRATSPSTTESPSAPGTPATPSASTHPVNPTLANLIGGGQGSTPTGTPSGTASPHTPSTPSPQAHQSTERHQQPKPAGLPHIPSLPLDGLPAAAAESVATVVSSATAHQLPTAAPTPSTAPVPMSTGTTPGVPGTSPMTPVTPTPLTPIGGGGGLATPAVTQPVTQGTPAAPSPAPQQTAPPRSPVVDAAWIQRTYGLAPGIESPKSETPPVPAIFTTELPEAEARLHRVLATIRQAFDGAGWAQPLAVATIRKGFETRCVYVTADSVSIHPQGVLLPDAVTPMSDMPSFPTHPDFSGSLMVSGKLRALVPRGWEVENMLSTVPSDEHHQSAEQYQELSEAGELLPCKGSRGSADVTDDEALRVFARAAIGSAGCGELDVESARLRAGRWVGVQPADYLGLLGRWCLADAADAMSAGNWGDAVYSAERYLSVVDTRSQAA
ncbi:hypothetical protein [Mycobacteroides abscessus]|uniref:hypothetical protein n=1 Tax=Mycobacteroides abscessus TaxID=36809 RepID=UPI0009A7CC9E|nr:hypothetical protein [Mycobacteroides abscessus]SLF01748.1 Uncharacterised protein [Mycobacteroides abscessus subsp. massiliense]